jgi:hypothetical protein
MLSRRHLNRDLNATYELERATSISGEFRTERDRPRESTQCMTRDQWREAALQCIGCRQWQRDLQISRPTHESMYAYCLRGRLRHTPSAAQHYWARVDGQRTFKHHETNHVAPRWATAREGGRSRGSATWHLGNDQHNCKQKTHTTPHVFHGKFPPPPPSTYLPFNGPPAMPPRTPLRRADVCVHDSDRVRTAASSPLPCTPHEQCDDHERVKGQRPAGRRRPCPS